MTLPAVIFDMDGLLLDTERLCRDAFLEAGRDLGLGLEGLGDLFLKCVGVRREDSDAIVRAGLDGRIDVDGFIHNWRQRTADKLQDGVPLKDGAQQLLSLLKEQGIATAVATSTHATAATDHLAKSGLAGLIDHIVGGNQVVHGKPAPDIYLKAAERLGRVATDCFAFEDSDPGTLAAVRAGARTVQVPDLKPPAPEVLKLRHTVAPSLLAGARMVGLIPAETVPLAAQ